MVVFQSPEALENAAALFGGKTQTGFETARVRYTLALLSNLSPYFLPEKSLFVVKPPFGGENACHILIAEGLIIHGVYASVGELHRGGIA